LSVQQTLAYTEVTQEVRKSRVIVRVYVVKCKANPSRNHLPPVSTWISTSFRIIIRRLSLLMVLITSASRVLDDTRPSSASLAAWIRTLEPVSTAWVPMLGTCTRSGMSSHGSRLPLPLPLPLPLAFFPLWALSFGFKENFLRGLIGNMLSRLLRRRLLRLLTLRTVVFRDREVDPELEPVIVDSAMAP
jgi:hypothetical protein